MSNENSNEASQSSPAPVPPNNSPQTGNAAPPQTTTPSLPTEDPFALDRRLIGEIQKGGNAPEHPAIQQPQIVRRDPPEKK